MLRPTVCVLLLLSLAGCGHRDRPAREETATASVAFAGGGDNQSLAIQVPGFSAKLDVPGLALGPDTFRLDGIPLAPGTRITGLRIAGAAGDGSGGDGRGTVDAAFVAPLPPAQLVAYYRDKARAGGWTELPPAAGQQFAASKARGHGTEKLAIAVTAAGTGSGGHLVVAGG